MPSPTLTRMAIVDRLSRGPASVSELARPLEMSLAAVVQHIQVLESSALVRSEKRGRVRTCRIEPATLLAAQDWIAARRQLWERQLDRLGEVLDAEDRKHETGEKKAMSKTSAVPRLIYGSFTIELVYPQAPARVFAAFSDLEIKARWFVGPPPWKLIKRTHDFRVGGEELCPGQFPRRVRRRTIHGVGDPTIFPGAVQRYPGQTPASCFTYDARSWNGAHRSTSFVGIEILAEGKGTRLVFTEHVVFLDGEDGTEARRGGSAFHLEGNCRCASAPRIARRACRALPSLHSTAAALYGAL